MVSMFKLMLCIIVACMPVHVPQTKQVLGSIFLPYIIQIKSLAHSLRARDFSVESNYQHFYLVFSKSHLIELRALQQAYGIINCSKF